MSSGASVSVVTQSLLAQIEGVMYSTIEAKVQAVGTV
jgi:hypothetical protein